VATYLTENPDLMKEVIEAVRTKAAQGIGLDILPQETLPVGDDEAEKEASELLLEEGVLELEEDSEE
jgi:hypothetical protein